MKLPNGYGSVVKLKGKRRKPWAVRISYLQEQPDGTVKRKRKYLEYFVKQDSALAYLAEYNNGGLVPEHQKYADVPTFAELYEKWKRYRNSLKSKPGASTWKNYDISFNFFANIHPQKVISLRAQDLQDCITAQSSKSRTTVGNMRLGIPLGDQQCRYHPHLHLYGSTPCGAARDRIRKCPSKRTIYDRRCKNRSRKEQGYPYT